MAPPRIQTFVNDQGDDLSDELSPKAASQTRQRKLKVSQSSYSNVHPKSQRLHVATPEELFHPESNTDHDPRYQNLQNDPSSAPSFVEGCVCTPLTAETLTNELL